MSTIQNKESIEKRVRRSMVVLLIIFSITDFLTTIAGMNLGIAEQNTFVAGLNVYIFGILKLFVVVMIAFTLLTRKSLISNTDYFFAFIILILIFATISNSICILEVLFVN